MKTGNIDVLGQHFQMVNVTTTQRDAIVKSAGLEVYNTTTAQIEFCDGSVWKAGTGTPGTAGSKIYSGTVAPTTTVGMFADDQYLNTANGYWYTYNGSAWVQNLVIKGTNGTNGTNGAPGTNGTNGTNGINGTNAPNIAYSRTFTRADFNSGTQQVTVTHGLGVQEVVCKVYDDSMVEIVPTFIKVMNTTTVRLDFTDWSLTEFPLGVNYKVVVLAAGGTGGTGGTANDAVTTFPVASGSNFYQPYVGSTGYLHVTAVAIPYSTTVDQMEVMVLQPFTGTSGFFLAIYENTSTTGECNMVLRASTASTTMTGAPLGLKRIPLLASYTLLKNTLYHFAVYCQTTVNGGTLLSLNSFAGNYPYLGGCTANQSTLPTVITAVSVLNSKVWIQASNSAGN